MVVQKISQIAQYIKIDLYTFADLRPLNLHGNTVTCVQNSLMNLRKRGRSQRLLLEGSKYILKRFRKFLFYNTFDIGKRKRIDGILQLAQFSSHLRRQNIRPGAQDLADFYEGRTKFFT